MKVIVYVVLLSLVAGCAHIQQEWVANTCNYDGSYAEGVNDSKNGYDH